MKTTKKTILEFDQPLQALLFQNTPNPNDGFSQIEYFIPEKSAQASIRFYAMNGQLIKEEKLEQYGFGTLDVVTSSIPSGRYSYTLIVDDRIVDTKSMIVTK